MDIARRYRRAQGNSTPNRRVIMQFSPAQLEADRGKRWQTKAERVRSSLPWKFFGIHASKIAKVAATVSLSVGVQDFFIETARWCADSIAFARNRSSIH